MSRRVRSLPSSRRPGGERGKSFEARRSGRDDVRTAAAWVLERTLESRAPADAFLTTCLPRFDRRDQGLLAELVLGSLRWLKRLDDVLARASHRPFEEIEPALRAPLRIGAYQLLFLDRVPAHAAVSEAVEQAAHLTHRGGASFANAVLRRIARSPGLDQWPVTAADPLERLAVETSHPEFLVARWVERFGEERARCILAANNQPRPLQLLAFRDRGGRELLAEELIDGGLEVEPSYLAPLGLTVREGEPLASAAYGAGSFYVQDEASQVAALLPPPRPEERVLDAAAAPGGKSFALIAAEPSLKPVLADVSLARLGTLRTNLRRLRRGLPVVLADAGRPPFRGPFDRIVADLPCSGTGTLRKHPELKWRLSPEEIGRLSAQALRMLEGLAPLLAPGGLLVAITCSLEEEENQAVGRRLLERRRELITFDLSNVLGPPLARYVAGPGLWQILPAGDHDGFTVQVFARRND
jgi:16S rRNA (cytosine967-C5)-methyltransferase